MTTLAEELALSRRVFILRLLVEAGAVNESVIYRHAQRAGVGAPSRDDIRGDLDLLHRAGCTSEEWLDDRIRVVSVTERGEDAAYGRLSVAGVERSPWVR